MCVCGGWGLGADIVGFWRGLCTVVGLLYLRELWDSYMCSVELIVGAVFRGSLIGRGFRGNLGAGGTAPAKASREIDTCGPPLTRLVELGVRGL